MSKESSASAATKSLSKREVALLSPDSKQQYEEAKERAKRTRIDGALNLFKQPSKQKINKPSDRMAFSLVSDYLQNSILLKALPLTPAAIKILIPSKYNNYVQMARDGIKMKVPSYEEMKMADDAELEYEQLKNIKPEPENYLQRARECKEAIDRLGAHEMRGQIKILADAVKAYHEAVAMRERCKHSDDDIDKLEEWTNVVNSFACLGVPDFLAQEVERRRLLKEAADAKKKAAEAKKKADAAAASARAQEDEDGVVVLDDDSVDDGGYIKDADGNDVPVKSVFEPGKMSSRQKAVKQKPKSKRKNAKSRTGLNNTVGLCMTRREFSSWILKPWMYKNSRTGVTFSGENRKNHGLTLIESIDGELHLHCELCNKPVATKYQQHLGGDTHQKRQKELLRKNNINKATALTDREETVTEVFDRFKDEAVAILELERKEKNLAGTDLSTALTRYRVDVLEHTYKANMTVRQLELMKPAMELHNPPAMTVGCAKDLPRTVGSALTKALVSKLCWLIDQCYPHFGVIADGSPLGVNAEAIIIRLLRMKDHQILDLLVSVRLFEGSLTGANIASNVLSVLRSFDLDPIHWRSVMMDRASPNMKAISEILRLCPQYKPSLFPCLSHTFSLPGKEFTKTCSILHQFRKGYNGSIMFRGKLYALLKTCWKGVTIVVAGGVRWYVEWEQIAQMDQMGIIRLVRDVIAKAEELNLSSKSVAKMKEASHPHLLPRLIVECGAVAKVGRPFCLATYAAEGNDPLVFGIYKTIEALEAFVLQPVTFSTGSTTRKRCKEAAALITPELTQLEKSVKDAKDDAEACKEELTIAEQYLENFDAQQQMALEDESHSASTEMGRGRRQRKANRRYQQEDDDSRNAIYDSDVADDNDERLELESMVNAKREDVQAAEELVVLEESKLAKFKNSYGDVITEDDFVDYAKKCVNASFEKYSRLFTGDPNLSRVRKALLACKIFDILYLRSGPSHDECHRMIDELVNFCFAEFDDDFIQGLKDEVPDLLTLANSIHYNFEGEDAEKEKRLYHQRVKARAKRAQQVETLRNVDQHLRERDGTGLDIFVDFEDENEEGEPEEALNIDGDDAPIGSIDDTLQAASEVEIDDDNFRIVDDWKQDVGERSRRIFDWWRMLMNERKLDLPHFQEAVKLLATSQTSSAAVERVFSQLTYIRKAVGDKTSSEALEARAFVRCHNDKMIDSFNS